MKTNKWKFWTINR